MKKKTVMKNKSASKAKATKAKAPVKAVATKAKAQVHKTSKPKVDKYPDAGPRDIRVVNIVVSTSLEHDIPLEKMAATLSNTEYNPEQFPGLVIRIKDPKTSALIFSSGKVVCTGARSMDKVHESIERIIESLKKIGIKITVTPKINIQNIVASGNIGMDLNLNVLAMKLDNTEYEPEQFPGLVYKLMEAKATFLLFSNGKVVCTGTKSEAEVHTALDKLVETLKAVK
jgi:transcription initiation factor TFIID TATA-box-binding protein